MNLSVIIPLYNEEGNIERLFETVPGSLEQNSYVDDYEILCVNDGSTDRTADLLRRYKTERTTILSSSENRGQSGALAIGIDAARYELVGLLDGDLQTTPDDFECLLALFQEGYDCVHGIRIDRQDTTLRKLSSRVANSFRSRVLGDKFRDISCPLSVFRKQCLDGVTLFQAFHRYIPYLIQMQGYKVAEVPVRHFPRLAGQPKYGISNRLWIGLQSLLFVRWMARNGITRNLEGRASGSPRGDGTQSK